MIFFTFTKKFCKIPANRNEEEIAVFHCNPVTGKTSYFSQIHLLQTNKQKNTYLYLQVGMFIHLLNRYIRVCVPVFLCVCVCIHADAEAKLDMLGNKC